MTPSVAIEGGEKKGEDKGGGRASGSICEVIMSLTDYNNIADLSHGDTMNSCTLLVAHGGSRSAPSKKKEKKLDGVLNFEGDN